MKIYKIANYYYNSDYGSWIAPSGKIYRVKGYQEHALELTYIFPKEGLQGSSDLRMAKGSNQEGIDNGFVRVVNIPIMIQYGKELTNEQKDTLIKIIMECPDDEVWITVNNKNNIFNKKKNIGEIDKFIMRS